MTAVLFLFFHDRLAWVEVGDLPLGESIMVYEANLYGFGRHWFGRYEEGRGRWFAFKEALVEVFHFLNEEGR